MIWKHGTKAKILERKEQILSRISKIAWTKAGRTPGTKEYEYVCEGEFELFKLDVLEENLKPSCYWYATFTQ